MSPPEYQTGKIEQRWLRFCELSPAALHDILKLRQDVFVVEQNCAFADIDGQDVNAQHLLLSTEQGQLVGCCRVLLPDTAAAARLSIGRVTVHPDFRGRQLGHRLMQQAVQFCEIYYPGILIHLAAQAHLQPFYEQHGFTSTGERYLEDGIPHVEMLKPPPASE